MHVNFGGFQRAVNYVGCVYVDVDRRYFNDNAPPATRRLRDDRRQARLPAAERPGRARLRPLPPRGQRLRPRRPPAGLPAPAQGQAGIRRLLRSATARARARSSAATSQVPTSLRSTEQIFSPAQARRLLARTSRSSEVPFRASGEDEAYLTASERALRETVDEFLSGEAVRDAAPADAQAQPRRRRAEARRSAAPTASRRPADVRPRGRPDRGREPGDRRRRRGCGFPFYFPTLRTTGSTYVGADAAARLHDPRRARAKRTAPTGWSLRDGPRRRVLRHPGHELDATRRSSTAPTETRTRAAGASSSCSTTASACAWSPGRPRKARLLGLEHALAGARRRPDGRHRGVAAAAAELTWRRHSTRPHE